MALSLEEISDRFEIIDLLTDYCTAIDSSDIELLDNIFTEDAKIDFSEAGGPCSNPTTIKAFLKKNLGNLPKQHIITNYKIHIKAESDYNLSHLLPVIVTTIDLLNKKITHR